MQKLCHLFLLLAFSLPAHAALNVFACEPEWAALTQEIAGDKAGIYTATTALQDPHHIEARPSLIAKARRTDLVICTGAELETAWLPLILRESGNANIQPGRPGYLEAASVVAMREIPTRLDRADGDIHTRGNPHIQTDPRNFLPVARLLAQRLGELDTPNRAVYAERLQKFTQSWQAAITRWEKQAAPLRGLPIVVQHQGFPYLSAWLGLREVATLEPKPGVDPSAAHLTRVLADLRQQPAVMVLYAAYQNPRPSEWLAERGSLRAVALPYTVGGNAASNNLYALFNDTLQRLLAGAAR
jgi:zinc/manganese transport system substrate-binding protein